MANDVVPMVSGFDRAGPFCYRSPDVGDFGSLSANGSFMASCTFYVGGRLTGSAGGGGFADEQYLWGTNDSVGAPNAGWSLSILPVGGQIAIAARIGTGAAVTTLSYVMSAAGLPAYQSRVLNLVVFATNEPAAYLAVNGQVVATDVLAGPPAPSALPVSMGCAPVTPSAVDAASCNILAAAYSYNVDLTTKLDVGVFADLIYSEERNALGGGLIDGFHGISWVHRYAARDLTLNNQGVIVKAPTSAYLRSDALPNPFGFAGAPASWPDSGNTTVFNPTPIVATIPYNPISLTRLGDLIEGVVQQPVLLALRYPDWYQGVAIDIPLA